MAGRQAPTSVVQNVISALVEDPAHLQRAAAAAAEAPVADSAAQALVDAAVEEAEARLDADELLKQAEEQAGDQVSTSDHHLRLPQVHYSDFSYRDSHSMTLLSAVPRSA